MGQAEGGSRHSRLVRIHSRALCRAPAAESPQEAHSLAWSLTRLTLWQGSTKPAVWFSQHMPFLLRRSWNAFSGLLIDKLDVNQTLWSVKDPYGWHHRGSQLTGVTDEAARQSPGWRPLPDATNSKCPQKQNSHRTRTGHQLQGLCEYSNQYILDLG